MTKKSRRKYLLDTSAVIASLPDGSSRYRDYFTSELADGTLHTSHYVRMEFIRSLICTTIKVALYIDAYNDINDAFVRLEQTFGSREMKMVAATLRRLLLSLQQVDGARAAAEEVGRIAVRLLRRFDRNLGSRIPNKSKCTRGQQELLVDFQTLLRDLREFYEEFCEDIEDCPVNEFLDFHNTYARTAKLVNDPAVANTAPGKNLVKHHSNCETINCTRCATIGDIIVALEQPRTYTLVTLDRSFAPLCEALDRKLRLMDSVVKVDRRSDVADRLDGI